MARARSGTSTVGALSLRPMRPRTQLSASSMAAMIVTAKKEVLIDRRRLTAVRVIARYEELGRHDVGEQQLCEELT